jgi:hypothetical protein
MNESVPEELSKVTPQDVLPQPLSHPLLLKALQP